MKIRLLIALAVTLLSVSACVVEPGRGGYRGGGYGEGRGGYGEGRGGGRGGDFLGTRQPDYGRRVWR